MSFEYIILRLRYVCLGIINDVNPLNLTDARCIQDQAMKDYHNFSNSMTKGQQNYINQLNETINCFFMGYESG